MPQAKVEDTRPIEVTEVVPPIPWWLLALAAGIGGITIIGGVIWYEETRKAHAER